MKRVFDFIAALISLSLLLIPLLAIALLVRIKLGSPILFVQERPGLNGQPFRMVKFRSMTSARDAEGRLLPDAERLPGFGRWLRSTSLDELPELWNVLRGDMSFVGPRPLLTQYLPLYNTFQARRHEVRPGITGWAQVNGRNNLPWNARFSLDIWYVDNRSLGLDIKIIVLTIARVLKRDGIAPDGEATMPVFSGSTEPANTLGNCNLPASSPPPSSNRS